MGSVGVGMDSIAGGVNRLGGVLPVVGGGMNSGTVVLHGNGQGMNRWVVPVDTVPGGSYGVGDREHRAVERRYAAGEGLNNGAAGMDNNAGSKLNDAAGLLKIVLV